jgi:3-oxoacyl-[acyl-carrier-protein] synthase II
MIAVTGIGVVSPLGTGKQKFAHSITSALSGISASKDGVSLGAVRDFTAKEHIPPMQARRMSRFSRFSLASAIEAMRNSGLEISDSNCFNAAVCVGTGLASTDSTDRFYEGLLREGPSGTNPMLFPETVQNIAASHISIHFGIRGPNITFSHSDISSELALFYGAELLRDRHVDFAVISGADEIGGSVFTGYRSLGLLSEEMMPFDVRRKGFVPAEGAATVIMERLEDARKRKARVYCTLAASAFSSSPSSTIHYDSSRESMRSSMRGALLQAGIEEPDFISAAANSSRELDRLEAMAIKETFGRQAPAVPVSAIRSFYGYFQGDGILRLVAAIACMEEKIIPATLGLQTPLKEWDIDYVTGEPRRGDIRTVMLNSFSSGGTASSIVLRKEG